MIKNHTISDVISHTHNGKELSQVLPVSFFIPKIRFTIYNQTSDSVMDLSIVYENIRV